MQLSIFHAAHDNHLAAYRRKLHAIAGKLEADLAEHLRVAAHDRSRLMKQCGQLDLLSFSLCPQPTQARSNLLARVEIAFIKLHRSRVTAGKIDKVIEGREQTAATQRKDGRERKE